MKTKVWIRYQDDTAKKAEALMLRLTSAQQNAVVHRRGSQPIPMAKYGFVLLKQAFKDAFCLRFEWTPERLASHSQCDDVFSVANAFSCPNQVDHSTASHCSLSQFRN